VTTVLAGSRSADYRTVARHAPAFSEHNIQRDVAEFGIGLAVAVALDAFILRTVLVPAAMHLFGNANWWLPRWFDRRLPHLAIEPPDAGPTVPAPVTQQGALR
jgi:uncharacterized membrane protein YdfJ with MMPL/SSD domain